jgi:hypothetical protein
VLVFAGVDVVPDDDDELVAAPELESEDGLALESVR